jgi:hypothetical protein
MASQELIPYFRSDSSLSPLSLGLSAVFGPQYSSSGSSIATDLLSRLLFMVLERLLRSIEGFASRYLDTLSAPRKEIGAQTPKITEEVKSLKELEARPKVTEAINGIYIREKMTVENELTRIEHRLAKERSGFGPQGFTPPCAAGQDFQPPWFVRRFLERRDRWMEWRSEITQRRAMTTA